MVYFDFSQLNTTYSIVAYDEETGDFGGAVQTHQVGVGRFIPTLLPGVGVICSQSLSNRAYNSIALQMMREGLSAQDIITGLTAQDFMADRRQVAVLKAGGDVAAFTGENCIRHAAHHVGEGYSIQANMMTRDTVIDAMREAYEDAEGDLAQRMLAALQAAQAEDGDIRGMQSAALKVVSGDLNLPAWDTIYDVRVDEDSDPVAELARLVNIRNAQLLDSAGHAAIRRGDEEEAFSLWQQARDQAPDQVEAGFWQAITVVDHIPHHFERAIAILKESIGAHPRRAEWLDLVVRLGDCQLIHREGAVQEILDAMTTD